MQLTPEQEALFPELGELREQIEGLQVLGNIWLWRCTGTKKNYI